MPITFRSFRRFPVYCPVTYSARPFHGRGVVWNFSRSGWRKSGDLFMTPGEVLSLIVHLPNQQQIHIPHAVVRWSRGEEYGVETIEAPKHTHARLQYFVQRLVREPIA